MRTRQYLFAILAFVIPLLLSYFINNWFIVFIISLAINIAVWIKGRNLAFSKSKKTFEEFKISYKKTSRILMIIFFGLFWVIFIGIFAAALIPRLVWVKWRVNDVTRKTDLFITAGAIENYYMDYNKYPTKLWCLNDVMWTWESKVWLSSKLWFTLTEFKWLLWEYLDSIPKDPNKNNTFNWIFNTCTKPWEYMYIPISTWWFILVAKTETEIWSNRVFDKKLPLESFTDSKAIKICDDLIYWEEVKNTNDWKCYYKDTSDLWYILQR